jgi:hypothetical protein
LVFGAYLKNNPHPHQLGKEKISAEHSTTFENHQVSSSVVASVVKATWVVATTHRPLQQHNDTHKRRRPLRPGVQPFATITCHTYLGSKFKSDNASGNAAM